MNKKIFAYIISLVLIFGGSFTSFIANVSGENENVSITSISPISGSVGDIISINGSNFKTVDKILIGSKEVMFESISLDKIKVKIPPGSTGGKITIKTIDYGSATSSESFVIKSINIELDNSTPSITSFSPTEGKVGDLITIKGKYLTNINSIYFGDIKTLPETNNRTSLLTVRVPKGAVSSKISLKTDDNKSIVSLDEFQVLSLVGGNNKVTIPVATSVVNNAVTNNPSAYTTNKGLVPKCNITGTARTDGTFETPCDFKYFMILINNLIKFLLFTIATPLIAIILCYVGWLYMSHQGSSENLGKAKSILKNVVIGYIVALVAWLVVVAILKSLGYEGTIYLENY